MDVYIESRLHLAMLLDGVDGVDIRNVDVDVVADED